MKGILQRKFLSLANSFFSSSKIGVTNGKRNLWPLALLNCLTEVNHCVADINKSLLCGAPKWQLCTVVVINLSISIWPTVYSYQKHIHLFYDKIPLYVRLPNNFIVCILHILFSGGASRRRMSYAQMQKVPILLGIISSNKICRVNEKKDLGKHICKYYSLIDFRRIMFLQALCVYSFQNINNGCAFYLQNQKTLMLLCLIQSSDTTISDGVFCFVTFMVGGDVFPPLWIGAIFEEFFFCRWVYMLWSVVIRVSVSVELCCYMS